MEIIYNSVKYKISCWSCCQMAIGAAERNFRDDVIICNLEQMAACENIHHTKV